MTCFQTKDFQRIKEVMINCLILALRDFSQPFILECDASMEGIGAVLKKGKHPKYFESSKIQPHEKIYIIYDK